MSARYHQNLRIMLVVSALLLGMLCCAVSARAQDLPGGVTCEQVVQYARAFKIPNTTLGRVRARIIAAALGVTLTTPQLNAAAQCLRQYKMDREYGCTIQQQTASGECR